MIDGVDFSMYVNKLEVNKTKNYNAETNASGNTVIDLINSKYVISVGIIPVDSQAMVKLQNAIDKFNVSISFRNPQTGALLENINCIIPENTVNYYTIQANKVMFNACDLKFIEL